MSLDPFINFDGNCREALDFYAAVFGVEPQGVMTYEQNPGAEVRPEDTARILYASLPIFGSNVMFSDCPTASGFTAGNNIQLTIGSADEAELHQLYERLSDGGTIVMTLGPQFFSELFAMVIDRFGIGWQLSKISD